MIHIVITLATDDMRRCVRTRRCGWLKVVKTRFLHIAAESDKTTGDALSGSGGGGGGVGSGGCGAGGGVATIGRVSPNMPEHSGFRKTGKDDEILRIEHEVRSMRLERQRSFEQGVRGLSTSPVSVGGGNVVYYAR